MEKYKKRPHILLGKQIKKNAFQEAKTQKRFAFAATNETSSRQHQRPRCASPALPPPSLSPCLSPFWLQRAENYGNRCVATCQAACDMVHTPDSTHPMHAALPPPPTPLSRLLLLHTLCGYLCLSLSMLSSAHGSLQQKRIFMLWPMFVLFELYVAFSIPYFPTPPHCSNVLYELSL